jgi:hypothetical protein
LRPVALLAERDLVGGSGGDVVVVTGTTTSPGGSVALSSTRPMQEVR